MFYNFRKNIAWIQRFSPLNNEFKKAANTAMLIDGQCSYHEILNLILLASNVSSVNVIIELGSYRGRSTIALALGSKIGNNIRVYAVDPHLEFEGILGGKFGPKDMSALYANLTKVKVGDIVAIICLSSLDAAKAWSDKNIGLLFIDGDHRYESAKNDYQEWSPFVVDDGIIAFHDYSSEGISRLLKEKENELNVIGRKGELIWLRKIPKIKG